MRHQVVECTLCCLRLLIVGVLLLLQLLAHADDRLLCPLVQLPHITELVLLLASNYFLFLGQSHLHWGLLFKLRKLVDLPGEVDLALVLLE